MSNDEVETESGSLFAESSFDRWGNRTAQTINGSGSGPQPQFLFNTSNNQITGTGFSYDAAGNMTSDGSHSYGYDANGNTTLVDNGNTSQYVYDQFNHLVRIDHGDATEYVYNPNGQRVSYWSVDNGWEVQGQTYWGSVPVEFYEDNYAQFQHQDWLGTERMRTDNNGVVNGTFVSLPFGDGFSASIADNDAYHFAGMDHDYYSNTDHAQFRQYGNTAGRWMAPDPYSGSYDFSNPQSFNRYAYVANNPMSYVDPLGLQLIGPDCDDDVTVCVDGGGDGWGPCDFSCFGGGPTSGQPGGGGGGGGRSAPPAVPTIPPGAPKKIAKTICAAIPSGRVIGGSVAGGPGIAGVQLGGEAVLNYNSGQTSLFYDQGFQVGCCNLLSGGVYSGVAYGLYNDNSNYSGGFTSLSASGGPISVSFSRSSNGVAGPLSIPPLGTQGAVSTVALGVGEGLNTQATVFGSVTNYTNPLQVGQFTGFGLGDFLAYGARQVCKSLGF